MTLSLPETKVKNLTSLCQEILISLQIILRKLASLIGKLRATAPAIIPAPLQIRNLQQCLIQSQQQNLSFESLITLNRDCAMELKWWEINLHLMKGKPIHIAPPQMIISSDAAKTGGWGDASQGISTEGTGTQAESQLHINTLELIAAELAIKTFTTQ